MAKYNIRTVDGNRGRWLCRNGRNALIKLAETVDSTEINDLCELPEPLEFNGLTIRKTMFRSPETGDDVHALETVSDEDDNTTYTVVRSPKGLSVYARVHKTGFPPEAFGAIPWPNADLTKKPSRELPDDVGPNQDFKIADIRTKRHFLSSSLKPEV
ncbi:MAG: hypothetical protein V1921_03135 [Candidatus Altiarchaeota archaeon]